MENVSKTEQPGTAGMKTGAAKHLLMLALVVIYTVAFILTFDKLYDSVQISSIALAGLFVWVYGLRTGLLSIVMFISINTCVLVYVSGKPEDIMLTYNPLAIVLILAVVLITGAIKQSDDKLNLLRRSLARKVDEETRELAEKVELLIQHDEAERIRIGRELHDGIGQLLTGMLLHNDALTEKLKRRQRPEYVVAANIQSRIQTDILIIRKLSRSLLPNHLQRADFTEAVQEQIDYLKESARMPVQLSMSSNPNDRLSGTTALHLYRILQEAISFLVKHADPQKISINFLFNADTCTMTVTGQDPKHRPTDAGLSRIVDYRARMIRGTVRMEQTPHSDIRFFCSCPTAPEAAL